jgi:hypothetical protein
LSLAGGQVYLLGGHIFLMEGMAKSAYKTGLGEILADKTRAAFLYPNRRWSLVPTFQEFDYIRSG